MEPKNISTSSPEEIIKAIRQPSTIAGLSDQYSESTTSLGGLNTINYTKGSSYMISVPASSYIQFEQKDAQKNDNAESIITSFQSHLTKSGLSKIEPASPVAYTVFDGEHTACQLVAIQKTTRPATISVACVTKETITNTYGEIDKLLALSSSSNNLTPANIQKITISEGNKTLTTLNVYGADNKAASLLFAAIGDSWEYLGDRPLSAGTTEANPTGINRQLSNELKTKIADPKYGDFLKKNII